MREKDIPQVGELLLRYFPHTTGNTLQEKNNILKKLLLESPWCDERLPSLVYEVNNEKIVGFLGVSPRKMSLNGQEILSAISHNLVVDTESRHAGLEAIKLLRRFLSGPQDLSITDSAGNLSRKLLEALGGQTAFLYSTHWIRILNPAGYVQNYLREKEYLPSYMGTLLSPLCKGFDAAVKHVPGNPLGVSKPDVSGENLSISLLNECINQFSRDKALRPVYDISTLGWLMDMISHADNLGNLKMTCVRNAIGKFIGWYIYFLKPGGVSRLLQVWAKEDEISEVIDHLFFNVREQGSFALIGRLQPDYMQVFGSKACLFRPGRNWTLIHSSNPEVLHAFQRGDAFFTRLEGESWVL